MRKRGGTCPLWKCCALVVAAKRPVDELFMHYFHKMSSASGGFAPRPIQGTPLGDVRSQTTPNLSTPGKKILPAPMLATSLVLPLTVHSASTVVHRVWLIRFLAGLYGTKQILRVHYSVNVLRWWRWRGDDFDGMTCVRRTATQRQIQLTLNRTARARGTRCQPDVTTTSHAETLHAQIITRTVAHNSWTTWLLNAEAANLDSQRPAQQRWLAGH